MQISSKTIIDVKEIDQCPDLDTGIGLKIENITNQNEFLKAIEFIKKHYDKEVLITLLTSQSKKRLEEIVYSPQIKGFFIEGDISYNKKRYCFGDLIRIMQKLTSTDGCPWDKEQTHESIRSNMIEEAYEAVDAINRNDKDGIIEELGDVMLQTVLNADIAKRNNQFTIEDVISQLCHKLYFRHTHIFGKSKADNASEALSNWEKAKAKEKNYNTINDQISRLPQNLPALMYCQKALKKLYKNKIINLDDIKDYLDNLALKDYEQELGAQFVSLCVECIKKGFDAEIVLSKAIRSLLINYL